MSVAFSSARPRSKGEVTQQTIQTVNLFFLFYERLKGTDVDGSVRSASAKKSSLCRGPGDMATGFLNIGVRRRCERKQSHQDDGGDSSTVAPVGFYRRRCFYFLINRMYFTCKTMYPRIYFVTFSINCEA